MKMSFVTVAVGAILVFLAVVITVVFIPGWIWSPSQTWVAHEYTDQEARGREIFYSNGCNYCHTQYVRYFDTGSGPVSMGGNYVFDNPMILGSERTGPDLSYVGRKRSQAWEIRHWKDPREMSPLSIMASFEFLSDQELEDMAAYLHTLGDRTAAEYMIQPPFPYVGKTDPRVVPMATPAPDGQPQGWDLWTAAGLQEGKEVFISHCQTCHGDAGNGLGTYGGTMTITPADFKQEPFRSMRADQWFWHVSEGIQGSLMPTWKASLTEEERWQVIGYIRTIFAHPVERDPEEGDPTGEYANLTNPVPLDVAAMEAGKAIFTRQCSICHGDSGHGEGPYGGGLLPIPPDFSALSDYADWSDSDYYWRISEGIPFTAMPTWKIEYSEEDRWRLVHYIRVNFTQTEPRPTTTATQDFPGIYTAQTMPETVTVEELLNQNLDQIQPVSPSYEAGKVVYFTRCAHCHGLTGIGDGWDGEYLDVSPANFTGEMVRGLSDGDWFARVSLGLQNSAMPTWGELMPERNRWDVIRYISEAATLNVPPQTGEQPQTIASVFDGTISAQYLTTNKGIFLDEVGPIDPEHGGELYHQYCAECHAADGAGNGPGTAEHGIPSPAAFPDDLPDNYIYWRIWEGVKDTTMAPFQWLFTPGDAWDVTEYILGGFTGSGPAGGGG
jgi:mono/diheme cytochrome c family protein